MAAKSPTELIRDLQVEVAVLAERLNLLRASIDEVNLISILGRLAVLDNITAELRKRVEEYERRGERLTVLESQFAEIKKQFEEKDRRWWQFWLGVGVVLLTFVANLTINLILFFARKPG